MAAALSLFKACFQRDANCWEHGSYSTVSLGEGSTSGIFYLPVGYSVPGVRRKTVLAPEVND